MQNVLNSIDIGSIGTVTLSNGQKFDVPKLTNSKLIQIAKFIAVDGMKLWSKFQNVLTDTSLNESEKFAIILAELPEETVIHILSILLDMEDEEVLQMDPAETLEIIDLYVEKTNLIKAFTIVRNLAKKFNVKIPDLPTQQTN